MFGEALLDCGLFYQSPHKALPHGIPARCLAAVFVDVAFAISRTKEPRTDVNWACGLRLLHGLFESRRPLKDASSPCRVPGLVWTHNNSSVGEISHSQSEHVATTDTNEKLESN